MATSSQPAARSRGGPPGALLYPLDIAYAKMGLPVPRARERALSRIPEPQRSVLLNDSGMTGTLERFSGDRLAVRPLWVHSRGHWYMRRVLLCSATTGRAVSMGAVRLRLDAFPPAVRARILRGRVPIGRLVAEAGLAYRSVPLAFFELTPGADLLGMFAMPRPRPLYGRRTEAMIGAAKVGDVIEILAPF